MTNLMSVIRENVKEQDLTVLNGNPFLGWDDTVDLETVLGGLSDRVKMVGDDIGSIGVERVSINKVNLLIDNETVSVVRYPALGTVEVYGGFRLEKYLRDEEIRYMGEFLMENFHH